MTSPRRLVVDLLSTSRNWSIPFDGVERIRQATPPGWEVDFVEAGGPVQHEAGAASSPEAAIAAADAEIYYGFGITEDVFRSARELRWVHSAAAGVGRSLFPSLRESETIFTNSAGVMGPSVAEHVVGAVLHFVRGFDAAVELQRNREWSKEPFTGAQSGVREVCECRVLIVGTGGVGAAIGQRLAALGAECVGVRRHPNLGSPPGFARVVGPDELDTELSLADVVVIAAPLTPETKGLLTASRIDCLRAGAIVVNVARGALIDEIALAEALGARRLRGAALDVFQEEPLPAGSPLWRAPGMLITPHIAAISPRLFWPRALDLFLDNWERYRTGAPLRNVVDKDAGY
jgi:phosphoglycerate dehydrogenase-like enzyme